MFFEHNRTRYNIETSREIEENRFRLRAEAATSASGAEIDGDEERAVVAAFNDAHGWEDVVPEKDTRSFSVTEGFGEGYDVEMNLPLDRAIEAARDLARSSGLPYNVTEYVSRGGAHGWVVVRSFP